MWRRRRSSRIRRRISYPAGLSLTSTWDGSQLPRRLLHLAGEEMGGRVPVPRRRGRQRRVATNAAWCGGAGEARNAADEAMRGAAGGQAGRRVRRVGRTRGGCDVWRRGGVTSRVDASRGHQRRVVWRARSNGGGGATTNGGAAGTQARPADAGEGATGVQSCAMGRRAAASRG